MGTQDSETNRNVEDALAAVLADDKFSASPQMSAFLKYVVQQTLYSDPSRIKAYTVAVDALGKPPTFDPQNDPSVRVLAKRLRGSLDAYYDNNPDVSTIIVMKAGSYVPQFVHREVSESGVVTSDSGQDLSPEIENVTDFPWTEPDGTDQEKIVNNSNARDSVSREPVVSDTVIRDPNKRPVTSAASEALLRATAPIHPSEISQLQSSNVSLNSQTPSDSYPKSTENETQNITSSEDSDPNPASVTTPLKDVFGSDISSVDNSRGATDAQHADKSNESEKNIHHREPSIVDRLRAIPRSAIVMGLAAGLIWFTMSGGHDKNNELPADTRLGAAMPVSDEGNASNSGKEYRPRPDKLTIVGIELSADSALGHSVVNTVSTVVSRFDHVELHRQHDLVVGSQRWPEDYQIHVHVAAVSGRSEINVQLIHSTTSRIAFSETLSLNSEVGSELSDADYTDVQNAAARWMQSGGPILMDYHRNAGSLTKEMACYLGVIEFEFAAKSKYHQDHACETLIGENDSENASANMYRAWGMISDVISGEPSSTADPSLTLETAAKAVEQSPYNSYAHITLAMAQNIMGDMDGSARSVETAMMLNPLDANILKFSANISETLGNMEKATQRRIRAAELSLGTESLQNEHITMDLARKIQ